MTLKRIRELRTLSKLAIASINFRGHPMQFRQTMDSNSRTIVRDGKDIGFLQWHPDRPPHITLIDSFSHLSLTEMRECLAEYERIKGP